MQNFSDRALRAIEAKQAPICVGLDPHPRMLSREIFNEAVQEFGECQKAVAQAIARFNRIVIDSIHDIVPFVKPQIAFYEAYGAAGIEAFSDTVKYAHSKGLIVIEDAKRNDIGSTVAAYASAHLGTIEVGHTAVARGFDVDAITVNAYLGYDGIKPFIDKAIEFEKGVFVLVKTSNPSSSEIQDVPLGGPYSGMRLYERMAALVNEWGFLSVGLRGFSDVGAVVGATFPAEAARLRTLMPQAIFLVPGYGAQGASGRDVVSCFNLKGQGAIVSSSRQVIYAFRDQDGREKCDSAEIGQYIRTAALAMRDDVRHALESAGKAML